MCPRAGKPAPNPGHEVDMCLGYGGHRIGSLRFLDTLLNASVVEQRKQNQECIKDVPGIEPER